jgi:hypothetical protein
LFWHADVRRLLRTLPLSPPLDVLPEILSGAPFQRPRRLDPNNLPPVPQSRNEGFDNSRISHFPQSPDGRNPDILIDVVQSVDYRIQRTWILDLTQCQNRRLPNTGVFIPRSRHQGFYQSTVSELRQYLNNNPTGSDLRILRHGAKGVQRALVF